EHLGAKNSLVYAGRGRVVVRGESESKEKNDEASDGLSIAERRRAARLAAAKAEEETVDDASVQTTDDAADVTEEEEN
ncbi:MAG: protein translocase subunit SecD, partial [Schaalia sp.]|nr:protein translocase subunit SecD [Schaalia sp.]